MSDLVPIQKGDLAIPDYLKDVHGREGAENVTKEDLVIPRLGFCQSTSNERKRNNPKFIDGLSEGDMFNTRDLVNYGAKVQVIPLLKTGSRIYFQKSETGGPTGVILCRSFNGIDGGTVAPRCIECPKSQGYPSPCTEFKNILSIVLPYRTVILVSFKSTALPAAKQWISRMVDITERTNKPFYTSVYEITTAATKNQKGEFFIPVVKRVGFVSQEDFQFAEAKYKEFKGAAIKMHESVEAGEVQSDAVDSEFQDIRDEDIPF
jgi:hypothetical protein